MALAGKPSKTALTALSSAPADAAGGH